MSTSVAEDDIIKKRLLIEGDSGNEDRQINKLVKNFVKWCNEQQVGSDGLVVDDENADTAYEQMAACLSHVEFGLLKNQLILEMNKSEQENYEKLYQKINQEIEKAKKKIVECKIELQEARKVRKNRQEYDVLAKQILSFPDRAEMKETIKLLEEKAENLIKTENEFDKKLDLRRKQFSVVLHSLSSMKSMIDSDQNVDDMLSNQNNALNGGVLSDDGDLATNQERNELIASLRRKPKIENHENSPNVEEMDEDNNGLSHGSGKRDKHQGSNNNNNNNNNELEIDEN